MSSRPTSKLLRALRAVFFTMVLRKKPASTEVDAAASGSGSSGQPKTAVDKEGFICFLTAPHRKRLAAKKAAAAKAKKDKNNGTSSNANVNANANTDAANANASGSASTSANANTNDDKADIASHPSFESVTTVESECPQTPTTPISSRWSVTAGPWSLDTMYALRLPEDLGRPDITTTANTAGAGGGLRRIPNCRNIALMREILAEDGVSTARVAFYEYWLRLSSDPVEHALEHGNLPPFF